MGNKRENSGSKKTGAGFRLNTISTVNAQCKFRFLLVNENVGAQVFNTFLNGLIYGAKRPVFLIVDGHPSHKAVIVKKF